MTERQIPVAAESHPIGWAEPVDCYTELTRIYGDHRVYLLESLAGPADDRRHAYVGFGELMTLSVTRGVVRLTGLPALVDAVWRRVQPLLDGGPAGDGTATGDGTGDGGGGTAAGGAGRVRSRLRSPADLWVLLRQMTSLFPAAEPGEEFSFGFLAFFGYDVARHIETLPYLIHAAPALPDICLKLHQGCLRFDLRARSAELLVHTSPGWPELAVDELVCLLRSRARAGAQLAGHPGGRPALPPCTVAGTVTREEFLADVKRCLDHIAVGDIYQVQIGHELTVRSTAGPLGVYHRLRARNPSPYMFLAPLAGHLLIGASPELFVRVENGIVTMRPLAGTEPCGAQADIAVAARRLLGDPKELAEHVMLVDLCRNDIGRICQPGTLNVPQMLAIERFARVLHLVSTVTGRIGQRADVFDVIAAAFPAGTMTGTPKVRAMEIIESVERSRRGMYAGALGLLTSGYLNTALCIRTMVYGDGQYRLRASAGVVADSQPEREWTETLAKLSAAHWAVTGQELLP